MGRRSRKRAAHPGLGDDVPAAGASRAERDAARRRRAEQGVQRRDRRATRERPEAPWGSFPLAELVVLLAIVIGVIGVIIWGDRGRTMLAAGAALGSLAGLEISIREHFAGFRSHTTLLSGAAAAAAIVAVVLGVGAGGQLVSLAVGATVFGVSFWALREVFKRRSGGLGFR